MAPRRKKLKVLNPVLDKQGDRRPRPPIPSKKTDDNRLGQKHCNNMMFLRPDGPDGPDDVGLALALVGEQ
jgi:hypothetical protein